MEINLGRFQKEIKAITWINPQMTPFTQKILLSVKYINFVSKTAQFSQHIYVEILDDDEPQAENLLNKLNLPITIKPILPSSPKRRPIKRRRSSSTSSNLTMINTGSNNNEVVVFPSGIKVQVSYGFEVKIRINK